MLPEPTTIGDTLHGRSDFPARMLVQFIVLPDNYN